MRKLRPEVWEKAKAITMGFEGAGYVNVAGNFDGQGLSLGWLQWNIGQGTLQPLLRAFLDRFLDLAVQVMEDGAQWLREALDGGGEMDFVLQMDDGTGYITDPWRTRWINLCNTSEFQAIQDEFTQFYIDRAVSICDQFELYSDRAFCLMFDIAVQNGSVRNPPEEITLANIAQAAADQSDPQWQQAVLDRKMSIVNGCDMGRGWPGVEFDDADAFVDDTEEQEATEPEPQHEPTIKEKINAKITEITELVQQLPD